MAVVKDRIAYLDVAKCFAILLVCIGHSRWVSPRGMECPLVQWIYTFHMPLFMLMCGFFSKSLFELDIRHFIIKEFKRLVFPIVVFTGLKIALLALAGLNVWKNELIGGMWFLRCLLLCDIIAYTGKRLCKYDWFVCLVSCVFLFVVPHGTFLRINYFMMIYWTGYFWRKYYNLFEKNRLWITICAFIICIVIGVVGNPMIIHFGEWYELITYYFAGIGWSVLIIGLLYYVCYFLPLGFYAKVGTVTLLIYGIDNLLGDGLLSECVTWKCGLLFDWLWVFIIGVFELVICYLAISTFRFVVNKCGYISSY